MMKRTRVAAIAALGLGVALAASACSSGGSSSSAATGGGGASSASGPVTLTFWNNATPGPGLVYYQNAIKTYEAAHPGVTIKMQSIQNEDLDGKLQTALNSGSAPDIFLQRGGGKMAAMVKAGPGPWTSAAWSPRRPSPRSARRVRGRAARRQDLRACRSTCSPRASTTARTCSRRRASPTRRPPSDELKADIAKLKAAGIAPVAVGAKDAWPAAHWYYNFALRECSQSDLDDTATTTSSSPTPCWLQGRQGRRRLQQDQPVQRRLPDDRRPAGCRQLGGPGGQPQGGHGAHGRLGPRSHRLPDAGHRRRCPTSAGSRSRRSRVAEGDPGAMMGGVDGYSLLREGPEAGLRRLPELHRDHAACRRPTTRPSCPARQHGCSGGRHRAPPEVGRRRLQQGPYVSQYLDTQLRPERRQRAELGRRRTCSPARARRPLTSSRTSATRRLRASLGQ